MYGYIYLTTNLVNGLIYVGQHVATQFEPEKYIGSGTAFRKALKEFKRENFKCELLEEAFSQADLDAKETYWIDHLEAMNPTIGYNLKGGGGHGRGYKHSEEDKIKCGNSWRGKKRPPRTKEHIAKLIKANTGFKRSEETKLKISNTLTGCVRSANTRQKMSKARLGKPISEETKQKISEALKDKQGKPVLCIETGEIFPNVSAACRAFNCDGIRKCLRGINKTGAGYHWKYINQ